MEKKDILKAIEKINLGDLIEIKEKINKLIKYELIGRNLIK